MRDRPDFLVVLLLLGPGALAMVPVARLMFYGRTNAPDSPPGESWAVGVQGAMLVFWPWLMSGAISVLFDFGSHTQSAFYVVSAQVIPILVLAELFSTGIAQPLRQPEDESDPSAFRRHIRRVERTGRFPLFLAGEVVPAEAVALYGAGSHYSSTFMVLGVSFALAMQFFQLIAAAYIFFIVGSGGKLGTHRKASQTLGEAKDKRQENPDDGEV